MFPLTLAYLLLYGIGILGDVGSVAWDRWGPQPDPPASVSDASDCRPVDPVTYVVLSETCSSASIPFILKATDPCGALPVTEVNACLEARAAAKP
jgi:hypothetical protein